MISSKTSRWENTERCCFMLDKQYHIRVDSCKADDGRLSRKSAVSHSNHPPTRFSQQLNPSSVQSERSGLKNLKLRPDFTTAHTFKHKNVRFHIWAVEKGTHEAICNAVMIYFGQSGGRKVFFLRLIPNGFIFVFLLANSIKLLF